MAKKNDIVSILMFSLSLILFVIFSLTIFFGGQEVGGAIYFIYIAVSLAFTILSKRIKSPYASLYRYCDYIADAFNILAAGSIIYYKVYVPYMVAIGSLVGVSLIVDIFNKNRERQRLTISIVMWALDCGLMCSILPFFFIQNFTRGFVIAGTVFASLLCALKVVVAVLSEDRQGKDKDQEKRNELEEKIMETPDETVE